MGGERVAELIAEYGDYARSCKLGEVFGTATIGEFIDALTALAAPLAQADLAQSRAEGMEPSPLAQAGAGEHARHVKRGSEYGVVGEAEGQISEGMKQYGALGAVRLVAEGQRLTVYRCEKTGKLWWCFPDEFRDGRFETVAPAQADAGDGWQPIETAPADGKSILAWCADWDGPKVVGADGRWWNMPENMRPSIVPTHWHPLPAVPIGTGNWEDFA